MRCTEQEGGRRPRAAAAAGWAALAGLVVLMAACGSAPPAPAPAPAPARPAPTPAPAPVPVPPRPAPAPAPAPAPVEAPSAGGVDLGPRVALPAPTAARTMDEFKKLAARRLVAGSPRNTYSGTPPSLMWGIAIIETELNTDGSVRAITVIRQPANPEAAGVVEVAKEAIRRGAPYGDMSRLPKPWKWSEVFLFRDKAQFKPRTLD